MQLVHPQSVFCYFFLGGETGGGIAKKLVLAQEIIEPAKWSIVFCFKETLVSSRIPSMYGIFTYIYHKNQPFM